MDRNPPFPVGVVPVDTIAADGKSYLRKYKVNVVRGFAITQTIVGILTFSAGILHKTLSLVCSRIFCHIGYGIWFGLLFCLAGTVGLCSVRFHPHKYLVLSNMILNIILASASIFPIMFSINDITKHYTFARWNPEQNLEYLVAFPILILISVAMEVILSIVNASLSCKAVCQCCNEFKNVQNYAFFDKNTQKFVIVRGGTGITPPAVENFDRITNILESREPPNSKDQTNFGYHQFN